MDDRALVLAMGPVPKIVSLRNILAGGQLQFAACLSTPLQHTNSTMADGARTAFQAGLRPANDDRKIEPKEKRSIMWVHCWWGSVCVTPASMRDGALLRIRTGTFSLED